MIKGRLVLFSLLLSVAAHTSAESSVDAAISKMRQNHRTSLYTSSGVSSGKRVTFVSLNLGFLQGRWATVPYPEYRISALSDTLSYYLNRKRVDVFAFQEIWQEKGHNALREWASKNNYIVVSDYFEDSSIVLHTGLEILVRRAALKRLHEVSFLPYTDESGKEIIAFFERYSHWNGNGIKKVKRGLLTLNIELAGAKGRVLITNTHLTPGQGKFEIREQQLKSHTRRVKAEVKKGRASRSFHLGDFNISSHWSDFDGRPGGKLKIKNLQGNAAVYSNFLNYSKLFDSAALVGRERDYTINSRDNPYAKIGTHTKKKPLLRLDYIFFSSHKYAPTRVVRSHLTFTNPSISDHYGVLTEFSL